MATSTLPSFPLAQQAQIIRSNQRDVFHVSSLREETQGVLRSWLGTRWLTRWDKEIDLCVSLLYYGLTVGQAKQTLGEEYTDIWLQSSRSGRSPSSRARLALVLLPTLPSYMLARWGHYLPQNSIISSSIRKLPSAIEILSEVNLAIFYLSGTYYRLVKRVLGIKYISSYPHDPNTQPPSYSLLGILLITRLIYRLITSLRSASTQDGSKSTGGKGKQVAEDNAETFIDGRSVSSMLASMNSDSETPTSAEEDERTILDVERIPAALRAARNCTLCLEERTASCATECGHLFCWSCIVGWGREKPECPLCRQSLNLTRLLPIYNL